MTDDPLRFAPGIPNSDIPPDYNILSGAISNCSGPVVQQLILQNPSLVKLKAWHGQTPLHRACLGGNAGIVDILLKAGANPNEGNDFDETPLHYSAKRGVLQVFDMLVQCGADVTLIDKNGKGVVHHAAETGSVYMLHYLSAVHGLSLSQLDSKNQSPLLIACKFGQVDTFKYLLRKGRSNPSQADVDGNTPIHITAMEGYSHMTWLLLEATGSKVLKATNIDGYTPYDLAAQRDKSGHKELVPVLKYYEHNPAAHPRGPILRWYWYLAMPFVTYAIAVLAANIMGDRYQGVVVFGGLAMIVWFLKNQMHRVTDVSRWPNPVHAGTFAAGIFHTAFFYFLTMLPSLSQYVFLVVLTPLYAVFFMYLYYIVLTADPGTVSQSDVDERTLKPLTITDLCLPGKKLDQFCVFCEIVRPQRTKHCRLCNTCFREMDHHCLFLLKCIAIRNHRQFVWFIALAIVAMFLFLVLSVVHLYELHPKLTNYEIVVTLFHSNAWHLSLMVLNALSVFWGTNLLIFQFSLISNGFTTFYQPKQNVDVLTCMEKCMNIVHFLMGKKPFVKNPFVGKTVDI